MTTKKTSLSGTPSHHLLSEVRAPEIHPDKMEVAQALGAAARLEIGLATYEKFWETQNGGMLDKTSHRTLEEINEFTQAATEDFIDQTRK